MATTLDDLVTLFKQAITSTKSAAASDIADALHLDGGSRWLSSRTIVTIIGLIVLLVLGLRALPLLPLLAWPVVVLVLGFQVCRTVTDKETIRSNGLVSAALAKNLSADGTLTDTEQAEIAKTTAN